MAGMQLIAGENGGEVTGPSSLTVGYFHSLPFPLLRHCITQALGINSRGFVR